MASKWFVSLSCVVNLSCIQVCQAGTFLGGESMDDGGRDPNAVRILFEVESHFGQANVKHRIAKLEELLRDLYNSLAKNAYGRLGPAGVRYALHRLFAKQHGWLVEGLDANGGSWNESSPIAILRGRVPENLQAMFEDHLGERGFGLHEVALLAVSLENLVRAETAVRIESSYSAFNLSTDDDDLGDLQVEKLLEGSFMAYLFETDLKDVSNWILTIKDQMDEAYPGWQDTRAFLQDQQGNLAYTERNIQNPFVKKQFNFERILHVAEGIHDKYGHYQDAECYQMKNHLLEYEYKGTGRILLSDFYGLALAGDWRYSESVDYLRQLGALDETDSAHLSVIVPNYVYGKSMCLASSSYYSVCCLDECERLLEHLERTFAVPAVEPAVLAAEIAKLPSSTVSAPRNLSVELRGRLHEIAAMHGGVVPLHGRLFAQFLSHEYPRECPFPHVSGTINPLTTLQWTEVTNLSSVAPDEVIKELGRMPPASKSDDDFDDTNEDITKNWDEALPWTGEEELIVEFEPRSTSWAYWTRVVCMSCAIAALVVILTQQVRTVCVSVCGEAQSKVFV